MNKIKFGKFLDHKASSSLSAVLVANGPGPMLRAAALEAMRRATELLHSGDDEAFGYWHAVARRLVVAAQRCEDLNAAHPVETVDNGAF